MSECSAMHSDKLGRRDHVKLREVTTLEKRPKKSCCEIVVDPRVDHHIWEIIALDVRVDRKSAVEGGDHGFHYGPWDGESFLKLGQKTTSQGLDHGSNKVRDKCKQTDCYAGRILLWCVSGWQV